MMPKEEYTQQNVFINAYFVSNLELKRFIRLYSVYLALINVWSVTHSRCVNVLISFSVWEQKQQKNWTHLMNNNQLERKFICNIRYSTNAMDKLKWFIFQYDSMEKKKIHMYLQSFSFVFALFFWLLYLQHTWQCT